MLSAEMLSDLSGGDNVGTLVTHSDREGLNRVGDTGVTSLVHHETGDETRIETTREQTSHTTVRHEPHAHGVRQTVTDVGEHIVGHQLHAANVVFGHCANHVEFMLADELRLVESPI